MIIYSPCTRVPANTRRIDALGLRQTTPIHTILPEPETDSIQTMFEPVEDSHVDEDIENDSTTCTCSKNGCTKLYCECFRNGGYCSKGCRCINCINTAANEAQLVLLRTSITRRNTHAFKRKRTTHKGQSQHRQGCTCKRSKCERGYCECFRVCSSF